MSKNGKKTQRPTSSADAPEPTYAAPPMSAEKRHALIREADRQTQAIMRLEVYKRIGYSVVAVGALMVYAHVWQNAAMWVLVLGVALMVLGALFSAVLYKGIKNGKKNVRHILEAAGVDPDAVRTRKSARAEANTGDDAEKGEADERDGGSDER